MYLECIVKWYGKNEGLSDRKIIFFVYVLFVEVCSELSIN